MHHIPYMRVREDRLLSVCHRNLAYASCVTHYFSKQYELVANRYRVTRTALPETLIRALKRAPLGHSGTRARAVNHASKAPEVRYAEHANGLLKVSHDSIRYHTAIIEVPLF